MVYLLRSRKVHFNHQNVLQFKVSNSSQMKTFQAFIIDLFQHKMKKKTFKIFYKTAQIMI